MRKSDGLILAANRLPATLTEVGGIKHWTISPGGMAAALTPVQKKWQARWIGWSGLGKASKGLPPFSPDLHGLFIPESLYNGYYNGIANGVLWPTFHGLQAGEFTKKDWYAYKNVNKRFADVIAAAATPGDLIWIHDFHLLLVPSLLRKRGLKNKIGLFLHIPFVGQPHLNFPHAKELLAGLLGVSLCGVQTSRDAYNLNAALKTLFPKTTLPPVQVFPIGIDYHLYSTAHQLTDVQALLDDITQKTIKKYVVLSVSRLDYTKGIITQLRAVEQAVKKGLKHTLYKLIVSPSREGISAYQSLKVAIDAEIARLQHELPGVIDFQYRNTPFNEICAWNIRADAALVMPVVDGMNLVAKEYLATKPADKTGVLVLSNQAGAADQLSQALLVDPTDEFAIAQALLEAQAMPKLEQRRRTATIKHNLQSQDVFWWANEFITALAKA